jgi:hypothetical protein
MSVRARYWRIVASGGAEDPPVPDPGVGPCVCGEAGGVKPISWAKGLTIVLALTAAAAGPAVAAVPWAAASQGSAARGCR